MGTKKTRFGPGCQLGGSTGSGSVAEMVAHSQRVCTPPPSIFTLYSYRMDNYIGTKRKRGDWYMKGAKGISAPFMATAMILSLAGCGSSSTTSNTSTQHVEAGDNAVVNTADDVVATTQDALKELQNYVSTNNTQHVQDMVNKGEVLQIPAQTKVYVEDLSFSGVAHIRIDSGAYQGQEGYIPYEQLTPTK
ncbi:hypothetical protein [Alicyclobacillus shizuokensis]|uniref:hypothetical protein n=1 Tax=Alicyclobacillus shizuokensis TaxID=392014 RepID=UPI0012ED1D74|nr:hypothetical protein [Alicyclobacillus shizuokensis]